MSDGLSWISFLLSVLAILLSSGAIILLYHRRSTQSHVPSNNIESPHRTSPTSESLVLSVPNNQSDHEYAPVLVTTSVERSLHVEDYHQHRDRVQEYYDPNHHRISGGNSSVVTSAPTLVPPSNVTTTATSSSNSPILTSPSLQQQQDVRDLVNKAIEEYKMTISEQVQQSLTNNTRQIQQNAINWMKNMEVRVLDQVDKRIEKATNSITTPFDDDAVFSNKSESSSSDAVDYNSMKTEMGDLKSQISFLKQSLLDMEQKYSDHSTSVELELQKLKSQNASLSESVAENRKMLDEITRIIREYGNYAQLQSQQEHLSQSLTILESRMREQENYILDQLAKQSMLISSAGQTYSIRVDSPSSPIVHHDESSTQPPSRTPSPYQMDELSSLSSDSSGGDHVLQVAHSPMSQLLNEVYFHEEEEEEEDPQQA